MKKVLTLTLLAALLLGACEKEDTSKTSQEPSRNRVITLPANEKTGNSSLLLAICIGHNANGCTGCVWEDGK